MIEQLMECRVRDNLYNIGVLLYRCNIIQGLDYIQYKIGVIVCKYIWIILYYIVYNYILIISVYKEVEILYIIFVK